MAATIRNWPQYREGLKEAAVEAWKRAADESASDDPKKEDARKKSREALDAAGGGR